jgi:hypothetical protein
MILESNQKNAEHLENVVVKLNDTLQDFQRSLQNLATSSSSSRICTTSYPHSSSQSFGNDEDELFSSQPVNDSPPLGLFQSEVCYLNLFVSCHLLSRNS